MLKLKFLNSFKKKGEDDYCFLYDEDDIKDKSWLQVIHMKFRDCISYLTYDLKWVWLDFFISLLCDIEMKFRFIFDSKGRDDLITADIGNDEIGTDAEDNIPKNSFYCQGCPYSGRSKIAWFFYGEHSVGYCYYLERGDFSFLRPTDLLWDGCKECGINEDIDDIEEEEE